MKEHHTRTRKFPVSAKPQLKCPTCNGKKVIGGGPLPSVVCSACHGTGKKDTQVTVFIAECSCGWSSRKLWTRKDAESEADQHVIILAEYEEATP